MDRLPHAVLDLPSRAQKGLKIERILNLGASPATRELRLLDVGTGSGGIAHYFAHHPTLNCRVDAVDTTDSRLVRDGFSFSPVTDTRLPFEDASFDVVISNHVIEHVGEASAQKRHLTELRRVLAPGGQVYLAFPNRWMLTEPHYHLPFLSWLPETWRTPYLRLAGKGEHYDCRPLSQGQIGQFLRETGWQARNVSLEAARIFFEIEKPRALPGRVLRRAAPLLSWLRAIIPTLVYVLDKRE